jgi:colanic acid/amylovoran biosynthesis glycosyltransferase
MIAIVCDTIFLPSETFIKRHILELAPGKTAVICTKDIMHSEIDFPVFVDKSRYHSKPWFEKNFILIRNFLFNGFTGVPDKHNTKRLLKFLQSNNVKAILAEYGYLGCYIQPAASISGIPLYVVFRGHDASRLLRLWRIRHSYRRLLAKSQGFICESRFIVNNLKKAGVGHPNTHVIHSGVDVDLFSPSQDRDENLILATGRFTEKKAPDKTILAFSRVVSRHPQIRLEMVGDGPLLPRCKDLVDTLGINNSVVFHGVKDHDFVRQLMQKACFFVQHSVTSQSGDTEGLPVAIQEAMSCGLAVVATRHAGIPEAVVEEETGLLVDEHDVDGMSQAIERLVIDHNLREKMGRTGRERAVEKFSAQKSLSKFRQVLGII